MFQKAFYIASFCLAMNCSDSLAFDTSSSSYWGKNSGVAAIAYFRLPFNGTAARESMHYGFALTSALGTAKTPAFRTHLDDQTLFDLKFDTAGLDSVRINQHTILQRKTSQGAHARYAMNVDAMELVTIAAVAGVAGFLVAVGDDEADRYCGDLKLADIARCDFVSAAAPLK